MTRILSKDYANEGATILSLPEAEELLDSLLIEATTLAHHNDEVAEVMLAVIDRFSDIYSHPRPDQIENVLTWVKNHWSSTSITYLDVICSILASLHSDSAREFALARAAELDGEAREMLMEVVENESIQSQVIVDRCP